MGCVDERERYLSKLNQYPLAGLTIRMRVTSGAWFPRGFRGEKSTYPCFKRV